MGKTQDQEELTKKELEKRIRLYAALLNQAGASLQEPQRVAKRLLELLTPEGPKQLPFVWTAEQKDALKVGDNVVAYPGVYPPHYPEDYVVSSFERDPKGARTLVRLRHVWAQEPSLLTGFDRIDPQSVLQEDSADCFDEAP